jgi:hypothetical protein
VKYENDELCRYSRYFEEVENHFCQLLNAHRVNDVRCAELHAADPLVSRPSAFEFEAAITNLKK